MTQQFGGATMEAPELPKLTTMSLIISFFLKFLFLIVIILYLFICKRIIQVVMNLLN